MRTDARGIPISTDDPAALEAFEVALRQYQIYNGDPLATIEAALERRPDFVMGHVFRAGLLLTFAEARHIESARDSQQAAERLAERAHPRERALIAAIGKLVDGDWDAAATVFERVLVEYPRDAFALQTAHLFDFLRGDAKNLRDRITRVLPSWAPSVPGYSFVLGMHAFGLEECNQYPEARASAERALELEPRDGWAVHAAVHCCEMQGQVDDGVALLEHRKSDWAVDNTFAFHNWWHFALFHHDRGDVAAALEVFDRAIFPDQAGDSAYQLLDATALLWRLYLGGAAIQSRAERVATAWAAKTTEPGFYAFNDVHAVLAFVMAGRSVEISAMLGSLERTIGVPLINLAMAREVGLPIARAAVAFAEHRYDTALAGLEAVRDRAYRFGGSHAQRDLITLTIIEAALRSGRNAVARHYIAERLVQRPRGSLGQRLRVRAVA